MKKIYLRRYEIVDKNNSIVMPHLIDVTQPIDKLKKRFENLLKTTRIHPHNGFKHLVIGRGNEDYGTYNCIFVDDEKNPTEYHFGFFQGGGSDYQIAKTLKSFKSVIKLMARMPRDTHDIKMSW